MVTPEDMQLSPARNRFPFWTLVRYRAVQLRNAVDQQLQEAPGRALIVLLLLLFIWGALYWVLRAVLIQVGRYELVALVAKQQIFVHFFLVLAVMLGFSNAILAFTSLFGRQEAGHLLAMPAAARHVVCMKWLEGMFLSSWSFLLLGVPLMLAVAATTQVEWYYYPLFIGHFLTFVIVPSTLGLLAAWAIAMWVPRRPLIILAGLGTVALIVAGTWLWLFIRDASMSDRLLDQLYNQLSIAKQPLLPSTWSAKGVFAALERRADVSLFYLLVVAAHACFFAWLTVNLIGTNWATAYSRARQGRSQGQIRDGWVTRALCTALFPYLSERLRTLMLKDLRGFVRDPAQWTQIVIMVGLLIVYAINLRRFPLDLGGPGMRAVVAFLNLTVVSLILATFTSRFVFPLLSLESQQLWLLSLLPTKRTTILIVKFIFSVTITGLAALVVMGLAIQSLELPSAWARTQLLISFGVCIGLSGLAVGLGARFPVLGQRNPARIASGFGGTFNLIASMLFVAIQMGGFALAGLARYGESVDSTGQLAFSTAVLAGLLLLSVGVATVSLWVGARHFERLEY